MGNGVLQAGRGRTECGGSGVRFGATGIPEQVPGSSHCNGMAGAEAGFRGAPPDDCPAARAPRGGFLETLALGGWRAAAFVLLGLALLAPAAPAEARDTTPRVLAFLLLGLQSAHWVIFYTLREAQVFIES